MKKQLKIAAVAALLALGGFSANAQVVDPTDASLVKGTDKEKYVKLIDNKGTIKYLRSANGITQITSEVADNKTVTTWQLGGELTTDTYIDAQGHEFGIKGVGAVDTKITTANPLTADNVPATTLAIDAVGSTPATPSTGFSVLIRDEKTGEIKKMLASDLLTINVIGVNYPQTADATANVDITATGIPAITAGGTDANEYKISVFRNGAKLRLDTDFNVTADKVTILITEVPMYKDDQIEIRYIK